MVDRHKHDADLIDQAYIIKEPLFARFFLGIFPKLMIVGSEFLKIGPKLVQNRSEIDQKLMKIEKSRIWGVHMC